jgi:hypothetical protein
MFSSPGIFNVLDPWATGLPTGMLAGNSTKRIYRARGLAPHVPLSVRWLGIAMPDGSGGLRSCAILPTGLPVPIYPL